MFRFDAVGDKEAVHFTFRTGEVLCHSGAGLCIAPDPEFGPDGDEFEQGFVVYLSRYGRQMGLYGFL